MNQRTPPPREKFTPRRRKSRSRWARSPLAHHTGQVGHVHTLPPPTPPAEIAVGTHTMTLRTPWWTIPEEDRLHRRAFTRPSKQLRPTLRARLASKPSPHLPIQKTHSPSHRGRCPYCPKRPCPPLAYHLTPRRARPSSTSYTGNTIPASWLQVWPGPIGCMPTMRVCTHVAGECPAHTDHIISKHNAACQFTHSTIRKAFKGAAPSTPHTRYNSFQQTPEPSPKPPDPSLKASVQPPHLLAVKKAARNPRKTLI